MKIFIQLFSKIIFILALLLGAGQVFAKKIAHHEIIISATPEQVWAVLSDIKNYAQWNPTLQPVGDIAKAGLAKGDKIKYDFIDSDGKKTRIKAKVKQVIPNQLLNQKGGIPGLITYDNYYTLEPMKNGTQTKVIIHEEYRGVYVWFWDTTSTEKAYGLMNEALAKAVMAQQNPESASE